MESVFHNQVSDRDFVLPENLKAFDNKSWTFLVSNNQFALKQNKFNCVGCNI